MVKSQAKEAAQHDVAKLREALKPLGEKQEPAVLGTLRLLEEELRRAVEARQSLAAIARALSSGGLKVSAKTLGEHLKALGIGRRGAKRKPAHGAAS